MNLLKWGSLTLFVPLFFACKNFKLESPPDDSPEKGTINVSIDASFQPVFEEQIAMYQASFPDAKINARYKSEVDCLRDLFYDSTTRMIVITRRLNYEEDKFMKDSLGYFPSSDLIAFDAVVVLLNKANNDTLFTMDRLRNQLMGKGRRDQQIIFDGKNATSTVRFIQDSILKGQRYDTSVVSGAANTEEVISFVRQNASAIGLIGYNRVGDLEDSSQIESMQNLKYAYVQCDSCEGRPFVQPLQNSINTRRYPLVRNLYVILNENYAGLGTGFSSFLRYERGQLIFRRSYLGTIMDFDIRNVRYNETLPEN